MAPLALTVGSRTICFGCGKPDVQSLKQCSGCRVTRYCSAFCQKSHWPSHRPLCLGRETLLTSDDASANVPPDMLLFLKWMDRWHVSVFQWAAFSADLAHQPSDYLSHNWCVGCLRRPCLLSSVLFYFLFVSFILLMSAQPAAPDPIVDNLYKVFSLLAVPLCC
ncbi:hypothetical protein C8R47DRAFT_995626 [Mycena vitilis]|nr:hypothetical protein C8R47DRAFT_995626 [Mycena vitilis]